MKTPVDDSTRPTDDPARRRKYEAYLKAELEAAATYQAMADVEKDPRRKAIFERLVQTEMRHASRWAEKLGRDPAAVKPVPLGPRGRLLRLMARFFGTDRAIPWLLRGESKDMKAYASEPEAQDFVRDERRHATTLRRLLDPKDRLEALRAESGGGFANSGSLRAAVLGVNDGLVSNFSLVMGVAGGTGRADFVLLAGVAGLLAGAFSMAAGEYVSMRSQRDVYEYQIEIEKAELEESPEEEEEELVLIYEAKGLPREEAQRIAKYIMQRPKVALDTMAREELGLDPDQLGSPWGAAASSFLAFVTGAMVPILPYVFDAGELAFSMSATLSAAALVLVGGTLAYVTRRNILWGALRMLLAGGAAAAVTFGVGYLIGVSVTG